jgi:hypothetical protein
MVNFIQILLATERTLDPTEGPAQSGQAFDLEGEGMVSAVRSALVIGIL